MELKGLKFHIQSSKMEKQRYEMLGSNQTSVSLFYNVLHLFSSADVITIKTVVFSVIIT